MDDDINTARKPKVIAMPSIFRGFERLQLWILQVCVLGMLGLFIWIAFSWTRDRMTQEIYATRLNTLAENHQALREDYERMLTETALTQIVVTADHRVFVRLARADGQFEEITVDADPTKEIYVDYVLLGNRLWIRRVFDADTPPSAAKYLDWNLQTIDWQARDSSEFGKAVYRSLEPGVWEITMSGNGSLALGLAEDRSLSVSPFPEVIGESQLLEEPSHIDDSINLGDIWNHWMARWTGED